MIETALAAVVFTACVLALLHMVIRPRWRRRVDALALRLWFALRRTPQWIRSWSGSRRGAAKAAEAAEAAEAAIRRARGAGRLKSVPKPPHDKTLH